MTPALAGPNVRIQCTATGEELRLPALALPHELRKLICPLCGASAKVVERRVASGDKLLVDRATFQFRSPHRFEPVVVRRLNDDGKLETVVKRIVGLPGESVQIKQGDVFIDGRRYAKSLHELKRLARPIVDFQHLALAQSNGREPHASDSAWHWPGASSWDDNRQSFVIDGGQFGFSLGDVLNERAMPDDGEFKDQPLASIAESWNQLFTVRADQTAPIHDLLLTIDELRVALDARNQEVAPSLNLQLGNGRDTLALTIWPGTRKWLAERNGAELGSGQVFETVDLAAGAQFDLAIVDGTLQASFGGQELFRFDSETDRGTPPAGESFFGLTAKADGCRVELAGLRILADLAYSAPSGLGPRAGLDEAFQLGENEYFVLGDNTAISDDSRFWRKPAVSAAQIIGRPLLVHWPAERAESWEGWIQVPSPDKIRYIR